MTGGDFRALLKSLCQQAGLKNRITPEAAEKIPLYPVTVHIRAADFPIAAIQLLRASRMVDALTFHIDKGVCVIQPGNALLDQKVALALNGVPLRDALVQVCDQVGASYVCALDGCASQLVTCTLKELSVDKALEAILQAAQPQPALACHISDEGGMVVVCREENARVRLDSPLDHVTLHFQDDPTYYALRALLSTINQDFTLDSNLRYEQTIITLKDVPVRQALEAMLRQDKRSWTYSIENDILSVIPNELGPPNALRLVHAHLQNPPQADTEETRYIKVPLRYARVEDIDGVFNRPTVKD